MGSNLRRQLREALPPTIKGLQRAVALEIADDARYDDDWNYSPEHGRRSKVRLAELVSWTAAKDELTVREMLRRLSQAGWEFRLPIGKDKNGNLLYAVPGKAMTFRVPDFEGPTTVGPEVEVEIEGPTTVGPERSEGPTDVAQGPTVVAEGPTTVGEGPTVVGAGPTVVGPPSPISSSSPKESPSSSPVAEADTDVTETAATEGGGGGEIPSSEEQDKPIARAEAFVASLDYRGKPPGQKRRTTLQMRVVAAFKAGWTERGLRRYLDISDDPNVRSAAAVYEHRLAEDELPPAVAEPAPPRETKLPPACSACLEFSHGAATNVRLRTDHLSFSGGPCPRCHPSKVPGDWWWPGKEPETTSGRVADLLGEGDMWDRAMVRAKARMGQGNGTGARAESHTAEDYTSSSVDDLYASRGYGRPARLTGTDAKVAGWMAVSRQLAADSNEREFGPRPMIAPPRHKPYSNPTDQSVYDEPLLGDGPSVDQSIYDEPF